MFFSDMFANELFTQGHVTCFDLMQSNLIRVKCKLVGFFLTNKSPFLDVYGVINLVGIVIKSHKVQQAVWKIWSCDNQINILIHNQNYIFFVIFPFETNLNFSRRQIRLIILGCLGDIDNPSLQDGDKKNHLIFKYKSLIIRKASKLCMKV